MYEDHWLVNNKEIYDIAVLTLATPVIPSKNVEVVKLADEIDRYVNTSCIMSGWGYTNKTLWTKTNRLQKAITMIISNTYCKTFWPQFSEALDKKLFLCVYNKNGKRR
uniref:Peptidase S1 domain-containing protein n=1 Tax=Biomphalaria glabrata TaxID=6526 RepID=A0A2C9M420_BIOGL